MTGLSVENLTVKASVRSNSCTLVSSFSASLKPGSICAVIGPNGAGKTSLLRGLSQLLPTSGQVVLNHQNIAQQSRLWRAQNIAYLSQHNVLAWPISAQQVINLATLPRVKTASVVNPWIELLDLSGLIHRPMHRLSGGEQARVHLARAMSVDAYMTLLDEPLAHLDIRHQHQALTCLRDYCHSQHKILVLCLHQIDLAYQFADVIWILHEGKLIWQGTAQDPSAAMKAQLTNAFSINWQWFMHNDRLSPYAQVQPLR